MSNKMFFENGETEIIKYPRTLREAFHDEPNPQLSIEQFETVDVVMYFVIAFGVVVLLLDMFVWRA